jgi:hypothetical protein
MANKQEKKMIALIDQVSAFKEFQDSILPALMADLKNGATSEQLRAKAIAALEAKKISLAIREQDSMKALALIKDIQDRHEGKAKERTEVSHKFQNVKEDELDAIVLSKLAEAGIESKEDNSTEH